MTQQNNKNIEFMGVGLYFDYTNLRLRLLYYKQISKEIIEKICCWAKNEGLEKIIVICRQNAMQIFQENQFVVESMVAGYFTGQDGYFLSRFIDVKRKKRKATYTCEEVLKIASGEVKNKKERKDSSLAYKIRDAQLEDIEQLQKLYSAGFQSYPTSIFEAEYLEKMIKGNDLFKVAIVENMIVSAASAEINWQYLNAEITDCVTASTYSGRGLLTSIISEIENDLIKKNIRTTYSLCRATEIGINKSLKNLNYKYQGYLINNCNIAGDFEDMNVWTKNK